MISVLYGGVHAGLRKGLPRNRLNSPLNLFSHGNNSVNDDINRRLLTDIKLSESCISLSSEKIENAGGAIRTLGLLRD